MAEVTKYPHGTFCWTELGAADPPAAQRFYAALFGWTHVDGPNVGGARILQSGERDVAGIRGRLRDDEAHWLAHVSVDDLELTVALVNAAGGELIAAPLDVGEAGRRAIIRDPSGAPLALWEPRGRIGAGRYGEVGAPCWFELATRDTAAAAAFFHAVFGWDADTQPLGNTEYTNFKRKGETVAGMIKMTPEWGELPPRWMVYFQVAACPATMTKTEALGGKVLYGPLEAAGLGRFAVLQDPQGVAFSVIETYEDDAPAG
ncbi:MAG: VOC family protein [Myxococcales bacterium]|nr:VOC family protein [Myxococcales bacterium]